MQNVDNLIEIIQKSQRTLFIMCGYPYSGKTLIAVELKRHCNITYVSIDDIFHGRGFDWTTGKLPNEQEWAEIFEESYAMTRDALSRNENVLFDSTNHTFESREKLRDVAAAAQAQSTVIFIDVSPETVWKRWAGNLESKNRPIVDKILVEQTIAAMQEPQSSEHVIRISND